MVTLNIERVNADSPYRLTLSDRSLFYEFNTDYGVDYTVGFMPSDLLSGAEVYEFVITNSNKQKSPRDPKLRQTILALVVEFFRCSESVMLYICETSDNRQQSRYRLFESWFHSYLHKKAFASLSAIVPDDEGVMNYVAVILRLDNPRFNDVVDQFRETVRMFQEKPGQG